MVSYGVVFQSLKIDGLSRLFDVYRGTAAGD